LTTNPDGNGALQNGQQE